jgi:signal transduction histidine kinase
MPGTRPVDTVLKVLIVDDEPEISELISRILEGDYLTKTARRVDEALDLIASFSPDIIISDLKMPGQDGLAFLKTLTNSNRETPFILMTAHGEKEVVVEALRLNAFDFLEKPFGADDILSLIIRASKYVHLLKELELTKVKMLQSAKMAALGQLAGGAAHEINTPLSTLSLIADELCQMAQSKKLEPEQVLGLATEISTTVKRIAEIVRGLLIFSGTTEKSPASLARLQDIMESATQIYREKFKASEINFSLKLPPEDILLDCRPAQIAEVLMILINNSCQAVLSLSEKWINIEVRFISKLVEISVTDSGTGISEMNRDKLFQPFFTTKAVGQGVGLGLCTSKGIIEAHKGEISLDETCPNTRFLVRLPYADPSAV